MSAQHDTTGGDCVRSLEALDLRTRDLETQVGKATETIIDYAKVAVQAHKRIVGLRKVIERAGELLHAEHDSIWSRGDIAGWHECRHSACAELSALWDAAEQDGWGV